MEVSRVSAGQASASIDDRRVPAATVSPAKALIPAAYTVE